SRSSTPGITNGHRPAQTLSRSRTTAAVTEMPPDEPAPDLPPSDAALIGPALTQCLATQIARVCMVVGLSHLDAAAAQSGGSFARQERRTPLTERDGLEPPVARRDCRRFSCRLLR